jgi:hypothetical protein
MQIRIADAADLSEIQSLLRANDLPVEDISSAHRRISDCRRCKRIGYSALADVNTSAPACC